MDEAMTKCGVIIINYVCRREKPEDERDDPGQDSGIHGQGREDQGHPQDSQEGEDRLQLWWHRHQEVYSLSFTPLVSLVPLMPLVSLSLQEGRGGRR